nr:unnamed protein product [Callosobruchus analis]
MSAEGPLPLQHIFTTHSPNQICSWTTFFYYGPMYFNKLPGTVKETKQPTVFKTGITKFDICENMQLVFERSKLGVDDGNMCFWIFGDLLLPV